LATATQPLRKRLQIAQIISATLISKSGSTTLAVSRGPVRWVKRVAFSRRAILTESFAKIWTQKVV
jgi:hypothetical protein